jgi:hypothetical protein
VQWCYQRVSLLYYACYIQKNPLFESLCLYKKPNQNPLDSFEHLSIHKWREIGEAYVHLWTIVSIAESEKRLCFILCYDVDVSLNVRLSLYQSKKF